VLALQADDHVKESDHSGKNEVAKGVVKGEQAVRDVGVVFEERRAARDR